MIVYQPKCIPSVDVEMADIYFKNSDARKGGKFDAHVDARLITCNVSYIETCEHKSKCIHAGVFSKAAKAIREADFAITDGKSATALKGVGKGIATYIQELIDTGMIEKLEELRAGIA
jgi:DNA polymerase/3'-5' exonuclease PolX